MDDTGNVMSRICHVTVTFVARIVTLLARSLGAFISFCLSLMTWMYIGVIGGIHPVSPYTGYIISIQK